MELDKKEKKRRKMPTISGFLSFLLSLITLIGVNITLLIDIDDFPEVLLIYFPIIGFLLGLIGLITTKRSRLYALWGIGISLFILIFTIVMIGLSWVGINPKP